MKHFFVLILATLSLFTYSQNADTLWTSSMGGTSSDISNNIIQTADGGFLLTGSTSSSDGDVFGSNGDTDCWLVKLDQNGDTLWAKIYGGTGTDFGHASLETADGGFITAASSNSTNGDVGTNKGGFDFWVFKLNSSGLIQWSMNYGGSGNDYASDIATFDNNGYVVAGSSVSDDGDVWGQHGSGTSDVWLIQIDQSGTLVQQNPLGGTGNEYSFRIENTKLGGYFLAANATSSNGDVDKNQGSSDLWAVKLSDNLKIAWAKTYGGTNAEAAHSIVETGDLGCLVTGYTSSTNGDIHNSLGADDLWVLKLDQFGDTVWTKTFGGSNNDIANSLQQIIDSTSVNEVNHYVFDGADDYAVTDPYAYDGLQEAMFVLINSTFLASETTTHLFKAGGDNNRGGMNVQFRSNGAIRVTHNNSGPLKTISNFPYTGVLNEQEEAVWGFSNTLNESIGIYKNGAKIGEEFYPNYDSLCYDEDSNPIACNDPLVDSVYNGVLGDPNRLYIGSKNDISHFYNGAIKYFVLFNVVPDSAEIVLMSENIDSIPAKYLKAEQYPVEFGSLDIGQQYRISANSGGADFTSAGAPDNNIGTVFIATGTSVYWGGGALYAEGITLLFKYDKSNYIWYDDLNNFDGYLVSFPDLLNTYDEADFTLAGSTSSSDGDVTGHHGSSDAWVVNMNEQGSINWSDAFGGSNDDEANDLILKDDGFYAFTGKSDSNDGDVSGNHDGDDFWTVNTGESLLCAAPTDLSANNITISSAILNWTEQGSSNQWELRYGLSGFDTTGIVPEIINENPASISGLVSDTDYEWYIRSICGDSNSLWVGPSLFTTLITTEPNTSLSMTFGGSDDDIAYSIMQTDDQNILVAGYTQSNDGDVSGHQGDNDYWILKLDDNGDTLWTKTFGGSKDDRAYDIFQSFDGNYYVTGSARSSNGDVQGTHGSSEYWPMKLDDTGDTLWTRCYGGTYFERSYQAVQTLDSGFIYAGYTVDNSFADTALHRESRDYWILKTDKEGDSVWSRILGGTSYEIARSVAETYDSEYVAAGFARSSNMDIHDNHGKYDMWVVKFDNSGDTLWTKSFGGSGKDEAYSIKHTSDSGFIVAGTSESTNYDVHDNNGGFDFWVVKMDQDGDTNWTRSYGGSADEGAYDIQETTDGNYLVAGYTESNDGDVSNNNGLSDFWIIKIDQAGELLWSKTLGGSARDSAFSIQQLNNGSLLIAGSSESSDGDVPGNKGGSDFWIVKMSEYSSCNPPSNLTAEFVNATTFELEWNENGTASEWQLMMGETGFDTTASDFISLASNIYIWDSLSLNTTYDWYVRSVCDVDDFSSWTGPHSFTSVWHTRKAPYLTYNGLSSEMLISWQLLDTETCTLQWGIDQNFDSLVNTTEFGTDHQHQHLLSGLNHSTKYFYKMTVGNEEYSGDFMAAPETTDNQLSFYVYGDHRSFPERHDSVAKAIVENMAMDPSNQSMLISTGDIVGLGTSETQWDDYMFASGYPYIDTLLQKLPFQATMGNHERPGDLFRKYLPYSYGGTDGNYYSYDYGAIHFTVIDQYTDYSDGSDQHNWLVNDLSTSTSFWKMIVLHAPGWSAGYYDNDTNVQQIIQPLCETYGVQFVFGGHQHFYARAMVNGVSHITTGGGGSNLYDPVENSTNVDTAYKAYHFCKLNIDGNTAQIYAIERDGDTIDFWENEYINCPVPSDMLITGVTTNSAGLSWTENGSATNWDLMLGIAGFDTTAFIPVSISENPYIASNLQDSTSYEWYIRSNCGSGDASSWVGPSEFTTFQADTGGATLPFTETWENYSGKLLTNGLIHDGGHYSWSFETDQLDYGRMRWGDSTVLPNNGSGAITMDRIVRGTAPSNSAILTLDLSTYALSNNLELSFSWASHRNEERPNNKVWVRGSDSDSWVEIYDLEPASVEHSTYQDIVGLDIDSVLSDASQTISASFQIRFGQEDNEPTSDDGKSDGISYDDISIIENIPQTILPATLPFTEGWEAESGLAKIDKQLYCGTSYKWDFNTSIQNHGRVRWGDSAFMANEGSGAITLDRNVRGTPAVNGAILTINLSNYTSSAGLELAFAWVDHRNEERENNKVWIRGSDTDQWVEIYDLKPELVAHSVYNFVVALDIDTTLANASPPQTVSETFQLKLGQEDNEPTSSGGTSDGISYDDIVISEIVVNSLSPVSLPFIEGWETSSGEELMDATLYEADSYKWEFETDQLGAGRVRWGDSTFLPNNGTGAITMDRKVRGTAPVNSAILTMNMLNYTASSGLELSFSWVHHRNEERPNNKVWIRGSETDEWVEVYDIDPEGVQHSSYQFVSGIDIDDALSNVNPAQTVSETFQLRLGQEDNTPTSNDGTSDGITYDDIEITHTPPASNPLMGDGIEDGAIKDDIQVYSYQSTLFVKSFGKLELQPKDLMIYDLFGRLLVSEVLPPNRLNKISLDAFGGYLIVKVISDEKVYSYKVFAR